MKSLRNNEGYYMLDHRQSPGLPDEVAVRSGLPAGAGKGLFETPTYTCSHCQKVCIVRMPRTEDLPYCPGCDHHICPGCNLIRVANGGKCKTFKQVVDEILQTSSRST